MKQIIFTVECEILDYFTFGPWHSDFTETFFLSVNFPVMRWLVPCNGTLAAPLQPRLCYTLSKSPWPFSGIAVYTDRSDEHRHFVFRLLWIIL
jgi:hypothetical protein